MDLRQLRYFVAIVEHGNMTRAADSLHVAQPALSQQISNLEKEVRGHLFERSSQGMKATPSGEIMFRHARNILRQIDEMHASIENETSSPSGHVSIGVPGSTARIFAASLLSALRVHPSIALEFVVRQSAELVTLTAQGAVDFAITVDAEPNRAVKLTSLFREQLYAALPRKSPQRNNRRLSPISLAALASEKLILARRPNTIRSRLEAAFIDAGLSYKLASEVSTTDLVVHLVASGVGSTVLPWSAVAEEVRRGSISAHAFHDVKLFRKLFLCVPSDVQPSPAVSIVKQLLVSEIQTAALSRSWHGIELDKDFPRK